MTPRRTIVVDTREKAPIGTKGGFQTIAFVSRALAFGDYALLADCVDNGDGKALVPKCAVERKAVGDFIRSLILRDGRRREWQKIQRATQAGSRLVYVLDGDDEAIVNWPHWEKFTSDKIGPHTAFHWIDYLRARNVQVITSTGKRDAARNIIGYLLERGKL